MGKIVEYYQIHLIIIYVLLEEENVNFNIRLMELLALSCLMGCYIPVITPPSVKNLQAWD